VKPEKLSWGFPRVKVGKDVLVRGKNSYRAVNCVQETASSAHARTREHLRENGA
jgi:hypothetical protein